MRMSIVAQSVDATTHPFILPHERFDCCRVLGCYHLCHAFQDLLKLLGVTRVCLSNMSSERILFVLVVALIPLGYVVCGVYWLYETYGLCGRHSALWIYSVSAMACNIVVPIIMAVLKNLQHNIVYILSGFAVLTQVFLILYGTYIFMDPHLICDSMKLSGLYTWAEVTYLIQFVSCLRGEVRMGGYEYDDVDADDDGNIDIEVTGADDDQSTTAHYSSV